MSIRKGTLKSFDPASYTAAVQLSASYKVYLEGVTVARNLPATELTPGRKVALALFEEHNAREAVLFAVFA